MTENTIGIIVIIAGVIFAALGVIYYWRHVGEDP